MSSKPWFKFYPGDYLADTRRLSQREHGAYLLLLFDYYSSGRPPPDDDSVLTRISLSESLSEWRAIRPAIVPFFNIADGVWRNERAEREISLQKREKDGRSKGAQVTNSKRWGSLSDNRASRSKVGIPDTRSQIPEERSKTLAQGKPARKVNGAEFDAFWNAYPKKRNKGDAEKAWKALKPDEVVYRRILTSLEAHKRAQDWQKDGGQFIPHPGRWLRARGWEDDLASTEPNPFAGAI